MAFNFKPVKDEMYPSDSEEEEDDKDAIVSMDSLKYGSTLGIVKEDSDTELFSSETPKVTRTIIRKEGVVIPPNTKVKQVVEEGGSLILETVDAEPNDPDLLPSGAIVLPSEDNSTVTIQTPAVDTEENNYVNMNELDDKSKSDNYVGGDVIIDNNRNGLTKEEPSKQKCHICEEFVPELDQHILDVHNQTIECQLCNNTYNVNDLKLHIQKEHCQETVTVCSLCQEKFNSRDALKIHIQNVHLSEFSKCQICNKNYKDMYHHVKFFHNRERDYECSYCQKRFQTKKLLYNHVQSIHLKEKTNCPDCKKDISVDNFSRHIKEFHEQEKKSCPQCGKQFGMSNLRRHIRTIHLNESQECPDCGRALSIANLNKHIKSVHRKLKKSCDICNEEVPYSSISIHKRKVHRIGRPLEEVVPRGPNLKLRKNNRAILESDTKFKKMVENSNAKNNSRSDVPGHFGNSFLPELYDKYWKHPGRQSNYHSDSNSFVNPDTTKDKNPLGNFYTTTINDPQEVKMNPFGNSNSTITNDFQDKDRFLYEEDQNRAETNAFRHSSSYLNGDPLSDLEDNNEEDENPSGNLHSKNENQTWDPLSCQDDNYNAGKNTFFESFPSDNKTEDPPSLKEDKYEADKKPQSSLMLAISKTLDELQNL